LRKEFDVLVKIAAAAINPVDYKVGKSILGPIVGLDFSGVVIEAGSNAMLKVGDQVYGTTKGSLAEFAVVDSRNIALKPKSLDFKQAAALPTAYLTGLQGLRNHGGLKANGKVLIIGASGGCGTAAVQIAKAMKASQIVGVCSDRNTKLVTSLGATDIVDYKKEKISDKFVNPTKIHMSSGFRGFDVVYDAASGSGHNEAYKEETLALLAPGTGKYVALNGPPMMWIRYFVGFQEKNVTLLLTKPSNADFTTLAKLIDDGNIQPIIASVTAFNEGNVKEGFKLLKSRRTVGKIVFEMTSGGDDDEDANGKTDDE